MPRGKPRNLAEEKKDIKQNMDLLKIFLNGEKEGGEKCLKD